MVQELVVSVLQFLYISNPTFGKFRTSERATELAVMRKRRLRLSAPINWRKPATMNVGSGVMITDSAIYVSFVQELVVSVLQFLYISNPTFGKFRTSKRATELAVMRKRRLRLSAPINWRKPAIMDVGSGVMITDSAIYVSFVSVGSGVGK
ncbi:hypothetical protein F2Q69_00030823 [Brassica cretica]|uniref:Uncharacterized protein n=1 Tax=Brassica cretica TaxID=69181 RepID=A0A8S9S4A2_BRACR|nr:hypothetical protein F2Q69_00030823 [Brassica cretica]